MPIVVIREITIEPAKRLLVEYHYRKLFPRINKHFFGGFIEDELVGFMSLGYGTQPRNTIKKIFPSLEVKDYFEIGRLCMIQNMPKNSESHFISQCIQYIKKHFSDKKILYTWSDGMLNRPGYIYQASNFYYGGYIWTDCYITNEGELLHPRSCNVYGGRVAMKGMQGVKQYFGMQLRYAYFLCSHKERKRLLKESPIKWSFEYPKKSDLKWRVKDSKGTQSCSMPEINTEAISLNKSTKKCVEWVEKNKPLQDFYAREESRGTRQISVLERLGRFQHLALL